MRTMLSRVADMSPPRRALAAAGLPLLFAVMMGSCGTGGGDSSPGIVVTVSPTISSVAAGATVQFTATVTGTDNPKVNWDASGGTITGDGLYTAPAVGGGYAIRATSAVDARAAATAIVNVTGDGSVLEPFHDSQHPYVQIM